MFHPQNKRQREDDAFMEVEDDLTRVRKKPRPLPIRTAATTFPGSFFGAAPYAAPEHPPPTLTPIDSTDDEEGNEDRPTWKSSAFASHEARSFIRPPALLLDTVMDLDTERVAPHLINGDNLSPWTVGTHAGHLQPSPSLIPPSLVNESLNLNGGRTATPICGHFTMNMNADAMMVDTDPSGSADANHLKTPIQNETNWWRRRRLPSPISEDEHAVASTNKSCEEDTRAWATMQSLKTLGHTQLPADLINPGEFDPHGTPKPIHLTSFHSPGAVSDTALPRKGKVSISMGYRADCDKCRRKVPGHYSHIIRS